MSVQTKKILKPRDPEPVGRPDRAGLYVRNVFSTRPETKLNGALGLKNLSSEREFRIALAQHPGVIDAIMFCIMQGDNEINERCQGYASSALRNLLLEKPAVDTMILENENCLSGLLHLLCSQNSRLQLDAITIIDWLSIQEAHQPIICMEEGLLPVIIEYLDAPSDEFNEHAIQSLLYLSSNPRNRFTMARANVSGDDRDSESALVSRLLRCMQGQNPTLRVKAAECLSNLAQEVSNQVLIANTEALMPSLLSVLDSGDDVSKAHAKAVLGLLSQNPACKGLL